VGRVGVGVTGLVNVSLYFVRLCDGLAGSRHPIAYKCEWTFWRYVKSTSMQ
jgi:hypothetical protein